MNVSFTNGWGIVRSIVDLVRKKEEGKYVLVKDPNNVCPFPLFVVNCRRFPLVISSPSPARHPICALFDADEWCL